MSRMRQLVFACFLAAILGGTGFAGADCHSRPLGLGWHRAKNQAKHPEESPAAAVPILASVTCFGWREPVLQKQLEAELLAQWVRPPVHGFTLSVVKVAAPSGAEKLPQFTICQSSSSPDSDRLALEACRKLADKDARLWLSHLPEQRQDGYIAFAFDPSGQIPPIVSVAQSDAICAFETIQSNIRGLQTLEPVNDWASRVCRLAAVNINRQMQTQGGLSIFLPMDLSYVVDVQAVSGKPIRFKVLGQSGMPFFDHCAQVGLAVMENDELVRLPQSSSVHGRLTVSLMEALKEEK